MMILGFIASVLIGISLGLIGGGGSILTVPVLVYLFGVDPVLATAYSLFIVGATSLAGVWPKYRDGLVDIKTAIIFGIPSIAACICHESLDSTCYSCYRFYFGQFQSDETFLADGALCYPDDIRFVFHDPGQGRQGWARGNRTAFI
jgi:hypothetical protein